MTSRAATGGFAALGLFVASIQAHAQVADVAVAPSSIVGDEPSEPWTLEALIDAGIVHVGRVSPRTLKVRPPLVDAFGLSKPSDTNLRTGPEAATEAKPYRPDVETS
jgi:hypothetical protein